MGWEEWGGDMEKHDMDQCRGGNVIAIGDSSPTNILSPSSSIYMGPLVPAKTLVQILVDP